MHELRVLWNRYQTAMESYKTASDHAQRGASWKEAQEWLRRYFDSLDQVLKRRPVNQSD
jgi:hypothetical protein